jgi:hypothetical protein
MYLSVKTLRDSRGLTTVANYTLNFWRKKVLSLLLVTATSFSEDPKMFDPRTNSFSAQNALLLAKLCNIAYDDQAPAEQQAGQLGLTNFQWIHLIGAFGDCYGFAASGDGFAVLAFRGTKDAKSWMDDLEATPVPYPWLFEGGPEVGQIHAGFGHALRDAWPQIRDAINKIAPVAPANATGSSNAAPTLWITGHSLGGALAVLAGSAFSMWSDAPIRP